MFLIDTILDSIKVVVDKVVPDADLREKVKMHVADQALEWYKMEASDRDSARKRETATQDHTTRQLAWVYTVGYFSLLGALLLGYVKMQPSLETVLDVLLGVLTAGQYSVLAYYFGSSSGSNDKTRLLGKP